jgi:CheY-like chemotaxis protein
MTSRINRETVLVIDDDPYLRELIEVVGASCGVPVLQAADCSEGLKVLNRESPRIKMVLLDYYLPGMQPEQCAAAIRARAGSSIVVVLVTAAANPAARAAELNVSRWIAKPFEVSTLKNLLTEDTLLTKSGR